MASSCWTDYDLDRASFELYINSTGRQDDLDEQRRLWISMYREHGTYDPEWKRPTAPKPTHPGQLNVAPQDISSRRTLQRSDFAEYAQPRPTPEQLSPVICRPAHIGRVVEPRAGVHDSTLFRSFRKPIRGACLFHEASRHRTSRCLQLIHLPPEVILEKLRCHGHCFSCFEKHSSDFKCGGRCQERECSAPETHHLRLHTIFHNEQFESSTDKIADGNNPAQSDPRPDFAPLVADSLVPPAPPLELPLDNTKLKVTHEHDPRRSSHRPSSEVRLEEVEEAQPASAAAEPDLPASSGEPDQSKPSVSALQKSCSQSPPRLCDDKPDGPVNTGRSTHEVRIHSTRPHAFRNRDTLRPDQPPKPTAQFSRARKRLVPFHQFTSVRYRWPRKRETLILKLYRIGAHYLPP